MLTGDGNTILNAEGTMTKHGKIILFILLGAAIIAASVLALILYDTPKEYANAIGEPALSVHFIDVGQGDSILLESKGEFVLVDAGEKDYGATVTRYIEDQHAAALKYVIATHPHSDHIGGMKQVLDSIRTENFITVETDQSTRTWLNVLDAVDRHDVNYIDAAVGATYSFGEAQFTILAPLSDGYEGYNNYSVVTKVECGDVSFLLTGDAEKLSEKEMIASGADLHADVLKLGHHGSSTSSTAAFLKAVDPSYVVISCGVNNDYGHPHRETMKKLELLGCPVYRTDEMGTVVAYTDGTTLSFSTERGSAAAVTSATQAAGTAYIGNKNSHVFHRSDCSGASTMSEKNKVAFDSREDAIRQGYTPCGVCNP
jgi:beta-lactamase superfamily II metal-dependent hydrolase